MELTYPTDDLSVTSIAEANHRFAEVIRKYRRAHSVSAIGHQIINFALMASTGGYVRRLFLQASHCSTSICTGKQIENILF